jgi:uncharacterized protein YjgD (DUF1641 family)
MKTEIERAKESIKEYRKGYGQSQLPTDCIIQLMMGHAKSEQLLIHSVVKPLKAMEEATIIDYCNEVKELFELPNHSNNAWKKAIIENTIVKMQEVLENF